MLDHDLYKLNEKFNLLMNVEEKDKQFFKNAVAWSGEMMELTIKEKYLGSDISPYRAEIWTCNFGVNVGSEINKVRPCLIISDDLGNVKATTIAVLPLTKKEARQPTQVQLSQNDLAYVEKELMGTVNTEAIRNVSKARLGRRIAKLNEACMQRVDEALKLALNLK